MTCGIVIPCYKESLRLPAFLDALADEVARRQMAVSLIAVDDGSGKVEADLLKQAVALIRESHPDIVQPPLLLPVNQGKGGAIRAGWTALSKQGVDLLCFADADGATPADEVCNLITYLMEQASTVDVVLGSRIKMLGKKVDRKLSRHLVGRCFATMTSLLCGLSAYDTQCGAKVFKREVFDAILPCLEEDGFAFDVEMLMAATNAGFRLVEMPVSWHEVPGSKVHLIKDVFRMALSLLRIRGRLTNREALS